jgi:hypothetical protein
MMPVCHGATLLCSCGTAPSLLTVAAKGVTHGRLCTSATVMDCVPLVNIPPFGGCTAAGNPLPPMGVVKACVPSFSAPWSAMAPSILLHGVPVLDESATLPCAYGGVVRVINPGQSVTRHSPLSVAATGTRAGK